MTNTIAEARNVFQKEIEALEKTKEYIGETFEKFVETILLCQGKVIMTGMGKSGHIARKMAATFSSLGTSSFFLHPAESLHGDLGMISRQDIVIALSNSGESEEIVRMIPSIRMIGAKLLSITGKGNSTLARHSDVTETLPEISEACHLGLAPTSSTTAVLVYGDALAVVVSQKKNFQSENFGIYHPAGALGKRLLTKVSDIMIAGEEKPEVDVKASLKEAIIELSRKGAGVVAIMEENRIKGIITDGDLRRALEKGYDVYGMKVDEIMTKNPVSIGMDKLAVDAVKLLQARNISSLLVVDEEKKYCGVVTLQGAVRAL